MWKHAPDELAPHWAQFSNDTQTNSVKRDSYAPNVPEREDPAWAPSPSGTFRAYNVTATAKNGGWNGGHWLPQGIGYGLRNHGWGASGAAAWYEANNYKCNPRYHVAPCTAPEESTVLLILLLLGTLILAYRITQCQYRVFYAMATTYGLLLSASLAFRLSGMTNSIDFSMVFAGLAAAFFPFVFFELACPEARKAGQSSWRMSQLLVSMASMGLVSAVDRLNFYAIIGMPMVEHAVLFHLEGNWDQGDGEQVAEQPPFIPDAQELERIKHDKEAAGFGAGFRIHLLLALELATIIALCVSSYSSMAFCTVQTWVLSLIHI